MKLNFVTGNASKVRELQAILEPQGIEVVQQEVDCPELQADTLQEVAAASAQHLLKSGLEPPFVLEDAGLFVAATNGFPGVYSRYVLDTIGCQGILSLLRDVEQESRGAAFEAHLRFVDAGEQHGFTGRIKGHIAKRAAGTGGFGFDPIFVPHTLPSGENHAERTMAELTPEEKDSISHRGQAALQLASWLESRKP